MPRLPPHRNVEPRSITEAGLARLLARLDRDVERAGEEYERLRWTLVKFFDWRGAWFPDECADATLDRLARKLEDTVVEDLWNYAHGIARLVLLERHRQPLFSSIEAAGALSSLQVTSAGGEDERLRDCFDQCLAEFSSENRSLILRYYQGERSDKISNRRQLAVTLTLSDNALRSRVQRLRDRLEHCVRMCVSAPGEGAS